MAASLFGLGGTSALSPGRIVRESVVGTSGQTVIPLTTFTYTPGTDDLMVYINGTLQDLVDYAETSETSITLVEGLVAGDRVTCVGYL